MNSWIGDLSGWVTDNGAWFTAGALVSLISWITGNRWERRKLSRTERIKAYSALLNSCSRWWAAFGDRDRIERNEGDAAWRDANRTVRDRRDDAYAAYTEIQIVGSQEVIGAALTLIRAHDARNKAYHQGEKGVGADERAQKLSGFVTAARKDLKLKPVKLDQLRRTSTS